ncbi:MAG: TraR/DksA C4-type zinc finger protein [Pirellulaceae bacterium]
MNRAQLLRQTAERLVTRRDALRAALAGDERLLKTLNEEGVGDEVDLALASEQSELSSQMAAVESRELAKVERALERIRDGKYGRCETCEKAIAPLRLKYVPYATECIVCARREERREDATTGYRPVNRVAAYRTDESEPSLDEAELEIG